MYQVTSQNGTLVSLRFSGTLALGWLSRFFQLRAETAKLVTGMAIPTSHQ